jgi:hypothetical protein
MHGHSTRKKFDLRTHYCRTILYQRSMTDVGIKLFNKLPVQIKQLDNYRSFEGEVFKQFILYNRNFFNFEGL